jgi:hypothetical protein
MSLATMSKSIVRCLTLVVLSYLGLGFRIALGQSTDSRVQMSPQPWPTASELATSDRGWLRLSDLKLSDHERKEVKRIMDPWMHTHCPSINPNEGEKRFASVSAERIRLQITGPKQLAVSEMGDWEGDSRSCPCGPNLTCHKWVLSFEEDRATTLFEYSGAGLVVLNSSSRGFYDIVTASFAAKYRIELRMWRFNGERYLPCRCASEHYSRSVLNSKSPIDAIDTTARISDHPCEAAP